MRVLLDTCVISELNRAAGHPRVRNQVAAIESEYLFLSVITLGEITKGITLLDHGTRKVALEEWLLTLEQEYDDRILVIDSEVSRIWGELTAAAQMEGHTIPACDGLIAATAIRHGLHVMTRNTTNFTPTGAMLLNPWGLLD